MKTRIAALLLALLTRPWAAPSEPTPSEALGAPSETKSQEPQRWAFVPILIANAETGVQVGALVMRFLNPGDTLNKPSTLGFAARVSQKKQVEVNLFPEWYLNRNLYHVSADLAYINWPADFYGIGNGSDISEDSADGYTAQGGSANVTVERAFWGKLSLGPQVCLNYESIEAAHPSLLTDTVPGNAGGLTSGLGAVVTYDARDAIYWARTGTYLRAKTAWYRPSWGSDFDYDSYSLEARQFFPLFETAALGLSATLQARLGDVPFRELSTADGDHNMRGLVRGKYRDRDLLLLQSEYKSYLPDWQWTHRSWLRNRLGWAVFAEAGQVSHGLDEFTMDDFRYDFGAGLRYAMNPSQRMNIRIDLGYVDGGVAPAINIKEAF